MNKTPTPEELINGNYYWVRRDKISQFMPAQYMNGAFFLCGDDPGFQVSQWEDIVPLPRLNDLPDTNVGDIVQPADDQENDLQKEAEAQDDTCGQCMGLGFITHPDTGNCFHCKGSGKEPDALKQEAKELVSKLDCFESMEAKVLAISNHLHKYREIIYKLGERVREAETWISEDALAAVERLDQNTVIELIQTYLTKRWHQNDFWRSSLQYFYEKGTVSGSLFQSLETMIKQAGFLVSIAARKQSLSELSAAKKQIEELKAWNTEQASIIESFMQEIERLKADKKQVAEDPNQ